MSICVCGGGGVCVCMTRCMSFITTILIGKKTAKTHDIDYRSIFEVNITLEMILSHSAISLSLSPSFFMFLDLSIYQSTYSYLSIISHEYRKVDG